MRLVPLIALTCLAACSSQPTEQNAVEATNAAVPAAVTAEAQAAQQVAQRYLAAITHGDFAAARSLWSHDGADSGGSAQALGRAYAIYDKLDLTAGTPGAIARNDQVERITVPVDGAAVIKATKATRQLGGVLYLSRSVDGAANGRDWHIWAADIRPQH